MPVSPVVPDDPIDDLIGEGYIHLPRVWTPEQTGKLGFFLAGVGHQYTDRSSAA